ncbi:LCP family protein [Peribacillus simplex]|uniref:LCP family glycopolymer transferase n=1 Tax=Peribacillus simplex TaxID=1478 RepID=UPI001DFAD7BC|nr:LCP family protein [Peribacillus simplex]MED3987547.1 LCP family protein [Peribacillus simplex]MED4096896.1 LCP family protein [Peribacillus simplex]CAH0316261.1 Transcriptional regulator LytR [Peribacillus simplex]
MENSKSEKQIKWRKFTFIGMVLLLLIGGSFGYSIYRVVAKSVDHIYKPLHGESSKQQPLSTHDPITILLLGVDERSGDVGRSDSMIVITVNPETKKTAMVSIPRDTRAFIPIKNTYNKINAAYAYGGIEGSVKAVEQFLNIPINYYVKVNMEGFKDIVDAVGGVTVNNPFDFTLEGVHIQKGKQHIDGKVALVYARMRKEDPHGDFGRQQRQREVIEQVIHEGSQLTSLANYQKILKALEKNVQTNLTMDQMIAIQHSYKSAANHIKQIEIPGDGGMYGDIWYYIVSDETRTTLSNELRQLLNIPKGNLMKESSNN